MNAPLPFARGHHIMGFALATYNLWIFRWLRILVFGVSVVGCVLEPEILLNYYEREWPENIENALDRVTGRIEPRFVNSVDVGVIAELQNNHFTISTLSERGQLTDSPHQSIVRMMFAKSGCPD